VPGRPLHPPTLTRGSATAAPSGFTLVEVLLSMGLLATIAALVSGMIYSSSQGAARQQETRRRHVRSEVVSARLDAALRGSTTVLAAGATWVVLWKGDSRPDQQPNLSEIQRVEWDAATKRLRAYAAQQPVAEADDTAYPPTTDFGAVTAALKGGSSFPGETWCERVAAWQLVPAGAGQATRLLGYTITLEDAAGSSSFKSSVSLRSE
jgi:prepilin-type N-terminal cleavage/methylation domain-containing protein